MSKNFIKTKNGSFFSNENSFRFIGTNMYELANVDSLIMKAMLKDASDMGFSVIRFWAFEPMNKEKLKEICDNAKEMNLKIIPVLADRWGYLQNYKIDSYWYNNGYKTKYLNYVLDIVNNFKDREEIFLWELINEPSTDSFAEIYNFAKDASEKIKESDPIHLISIGTVGGIGDKFGNFFSRFKASNFEKLYSLKSLDAISIHDYSFNSTILERLDMMYRLEGKPNNSKLFSLLDEIINFIPDKIDKFFLKKFKKTPDFPLTLRSLWRKYNKKDIMIAKKLNKPVYVGEVGFKKHSGIPRKILLEIELKKYFEEGIAGILLWSFEAQGKSLDGHDYGFNKEDGFSEIIKAF